MKRFFNTIANSYDRRVEPGVIVIFYLLGFLVQYLAPVFQIIIASVFSIILLIFLIKTIKEKRSLAYIALSAVGVMLPIIFIVIKIFTLRLGNMDRYFPMFVIVFVLIYLITIISCIKLAYESGDKKRIKQVKVGVVILLGVVVSVLVLLLL
ncbi:MAG: hypothetical protein Q8936_10720 [Bacillota bacterium]|nr:hypothetical protein [Bacillota bacterium]